VPELVQEDERREAEDDDEPAIAARSDYFAEVAT
jgi:hypothetical protein